MSARDMLLAIMAESGLDVPTLAKRVGTSKTVMARQLRSAEMSMRYDNLEAVAAAAGLKLVVVPTESPHDNAEAFRFELAQLKSRATPNSTVEQSLVRWLNKRGLSGWEPLRVSRRNQQTKVIWTVIFKRRLNWRGKDAQGRT